MNARKVLLAAGLATVLTGPVAAQQMKTVGGLVINIGIMNALQVEHVDEKHGVHTGGHGSGTLISPPSPLSATSTSNARPFTMSACLPSMETCA